MYRADDGRAISTMTAIELANAFNARLVDETRHRYPESMAHQELYHAGLSVCSQKVRTVLAELEQPYVSHELSILNSRGIYSEELTPAENYYPEYVKLRMLGANKRDWGSHPVIAAVRQSPARDLTPALCRLLWIMKKTASWLIHCAFVSTSLTAQTPRKGCSEIRHRSEPISCNKHPLSTERHSRRSCTDFIQMTIDDQNSS